jgi:mRNA interferase RelE/StbE
LIYHIIIEEKARKEAKIVPAKHRAVIDRKIFSLASNPRPPSSQKLTEKEGYRLSAGNYRILYTVDDEMKTVVIYRIKTKGKNVYK